MRYYQQYSPMINEPASKNEQTGGHRHSLTGFCFAIQTKLLIQIIKKRLPVGEKLDQRVTYTAI